MLSELKEKRKVIGVKQSLKAVKNGDALCVYLADDADPSILHPIRMLCEENGIAVIPVESMAALGRACEIDVGAAVAVLLKDA